MVLYMCGNIWWSIGRRRLILRSSGFHRVTRSRSRSRRTHICCEKISRFDSKIERYTRPPHAYKYHQSGENIRRPYKYHRQSSAVQLRCNAIDGGARHALRQSQRASSRSTAYLPVFSIGQFWCCPTCTIIAVLFKLGIGRSCSCHIANRHQQCGDANPESSSGQFFVDGDVPGNFGGCQGCRG